MIEVIVTYELERLMARFVGLGVHVELQYGRARRCEKSAITSRVSLPLGVSLGSSKTKKSPPLSPCRVSLPKSRHRASIPAPP